MTHERRKRDTVQPRLIPGDVDALVVTQANSLATSIQAMSLLERRLLLLALAVLRRADTELPYVRIYSSDVRRAFELNHNSLNTELNDATSKLMTRYAEFLRSSNGSNSKISWVNEIHFTTGKDSEVGMAYVDIQLHPRMAQYVLQLTGNFFKVPFAVLAQFRSLYSMRLCEILTAESQAGRRREIYFELATLKQTLDCDKASYTNFSNFRRRVLEPARLENAEVGYLDFSYETVKRGQAVIGLQFFVIFDPSRTAAERLDIEPTEEDVKRLALENAFREAGFTDNPKRYFDKLGVDTIEKIYREARKTQAGNRGTKREIKNFGGFLHAQLKTALDTPTLVQAELLPLPAHMTGTELQAAAEALVQNLASQRTQSAWMHYQTLPVAEQDNLSQRIDSLDFWTKQNVEREGKEGPSFKGAIRRILESSGFQYPSDLENVQAFAKSGALTDIHNESKAKIIKLATEIE